MHRAQSEAERHAFRTVTQYTLLRVISFDNVCEVCLTGKLIKDSITEMFMSAPVFLPGESQGWGGLVGCRLWGLTESDMIEVTLQQQPLTKAISNFHKNFRCHVRKVSSINHIVHTV